MCGRYQLNLDVKTMMKSFKIGKNKVGYFNGGEAFPSNDLPIIYQDQDQVLDIGKWGFELWNSSRLVINARSETVDQKPMFKKYFESQRCLVPISYFYEWKEEEDGSKTKTRIYPYRKENTLLAGIYKYELGDDGKNQLTYTILTGPSSGKMMEIHKRAPISVSNENIGTWLNKESSKSDLEKIIEASKEIQYLFEADERDKGPRQLSLL